MATHNQLGKEGEQLAADYLLKKGFVILHRNWRYSFYEIDIIALKEDVVHVVEVKLRTSDAFGPPEHAVNKKKFRDLMKAADVFLSQHPQYRYLQFDILSISDQGGKREFFMIEDVFF